MSARCFDSVVLLTDSERIEDAARAWGGIVVRTTSMCRNGTERVAEFAETSDADYLVNVQGDEVELTERLLERLVVEGLKRLESVSTLVFRIQSLDVLLDPDTVKVAQTTSGVAQYFSRSAIPHQRDVPISQWLSKTNFWGHFGVYGYSRQILTRYRHTPSSPLEQAECLEQLRFFELGVPINCIASESVGRSINRPSDLMGPVVAAAGDGGISRTN